MCCMRMCAAGKAVVHTYTAGNEPYSVWEGLQRGSKEYEELKQQRAETLWKVGETLSAVCVRRAGHARHNLHSAVTCDDSSVCAAKLQHSCASHDPVLCALAAHRDG